MGASEIIRIAFSVVLISCTNNKPQSSGFGKTLRISDSISNSDSLILDGENYYGIAYDGGSEVRAYFDSGRISKIKTWIGLSNGYNTAEYNFTRPDKWIVHETDYRFYFNPESRQFDLDSTELIFSGDYSFRGDSLVSQVTVGHNRFENDELDARTFWIEQKDSLLKFISKNQH